MTPRGTYELTVPHSREVALRIRLFERYRWLWRGVDESLRQTCPGDCSTRRTGQIPELVPG